MCLSLMDDLENITHPHLYMTMSLQYLTHQLDQLDAMGFARETSLSLLNLSENDLTDPKACLFLLQQYGSSFRA